VLADAIIDSLDVLDLFDMDSQPVLIANGDLRVVNSELLRWICQESFCTKQAVQKIMVTGAVGYVIEHRPVQPSEMAIRTMLTKGPKEGGLIGRLPPLKIEESRHEAAPPTAEPTPVLDERGQLEYAAGQRALARFANPEARTQLEMARGAEVLAKYQNQRAAVEPPVVEEHQVFAGKPNDSVDPTSTQA
jgi:hypothetical protein